MHHQLINSSDDNGEQVALAMIQVSSRQFTRLSWILALFCFLLCANLFGLQEREGGEAQYENSKTSQYLTQSSEAFCPPAPACPAAPTCPTCPACPPPIAKDNCFRAMINRASPAYFKKVDLAPYDEISKEIAAFLKEITPEGHSGQVVKERQLYVAQASRPEIRTICETGFNAGHSTALWLTAAPNAHVYSFDLGTHEYFVQAREFINTKFPGRLTVTAGDSSQTVPKFFAEHPEIKCDIISVDGGHSYEIAMADINSFAVAAKECTVLFIDDTNCEPGYCVDKPMNEKIEAGFITDIRRFSETTERGLTMLRYILSDEKD